MPFDIAGNTLNTALGLNLNSNSQSFADWVGTSDTNDFYRFNLSSGSSLSLYLSNLSDDANVQIIRDYNLNGVVNTGEIITGCYTTGSAAESLKASLDSGTYFIQVYSVQGGTNYNLSVSAQSLNSAPNSLQFNLNNTNLKTADTLSINNGAVYDGNGATDISKVDFRIKKADGTFVDVTDVTSLTPTTSDNRWGSFNYNLSLSGLNLATGNYSLWAVAYDKAGAASNVVERTFSLTSNLAPNNLQFNLNNTNLKTADTLSINNGAVYDGNGATDISKVDFRIKKADGTFVDVTDVTSLTPTTSDNRWGSFNYNLSLSGLNLATGNYSLWAVAYDKAGAASNVVERTFSLTSNLAPNNLQFNLNNTNLKTADTLSINNGAVYDGNGATDISKVDFRIKKADGTFVDVTDVTSLTPTTSDNRWGSFNYNLSLSGLNLATGNYSLWAVAYDKAGAASNVVEQAFTIQAVGDWFSQNLKDQQIIELTRQRVADSKLSRQDMIDIFRNAEDGGVVDSNEVADLRTIVSQSSQFNMEDYVRVLSNKVVNGDVANKNYQGSLLGNLYAGSSADQMDKLIDKWFLGGDRPTAPSGFTMTYQQANGSLFGNDGTFSYQDIKQGFLGDCYFLASLGATALQRPSAIQNMFIDNGDGTFTVRLFGENNGKVTTSNDYLTVDRLLPTNVSGNGYTGQRFAKYDSLNLGLWVALAEKAYAQFAESGLSQRDSNTNSYGNIEGGWGYRVMPSLSGISGGYYANTSWSNTGPRLGAFLSLSEISSMLSSGKTMTADAISNPGLNIVGGHEYTIISADTSNGTLTLYNPWGTSRQGETNGVRIISYNDFLTNFLMINAA